MLSGMSGNEWVKTWGDASLPRYVDRDANQANIVVTLSEEPRLPLDQFTQNLEDVSVVLAFCAFLGSDETRFEVRDADLEKLHVKRAHYGSPLEILIESIGPIAGYIILGAGGLAKILKWSAEAFKIREEGLEIRNRRQREDFDEQVMIDVFGRMADELDAPSRKQLAKILKGLTGTKRERKLARALANTTRKKIEIRINEPGSK